ncbi:hypothetical protein [Jeotgalibacillus terrae]|uniref:Phage protein n=1 Tax=Jeotgalibacillus terrae TaxID=587735 RepID=A0ABW5ZEE0_9BACL|nr:hypothetical protein [Jeotgalibacillus terrae]MBM7577700.1 hypothetical protein [Jeotgalibacillus terrae]
MNTKLDKIEQEVLKEFKEKFSKDDDGISDLLIQMSTLSAKVTKSFLEKYEREQQDQ